MDADLGSAASVSRACYAGKMTDNETSEVPPEPPEGGTVTEDRSKWSPDLVALYDEGPELAGLYEALGEHCYSTIPEVHETRAVAAALAERGLRITLSAVPGEQPALSAKHSITLASIDRGTPEWQLNCHHGADEFQAYTESGELDPQFTGECVLTEWWGEHSIDLVDIREPVSSLPIPVEASWSGDCWDLTLGAAPSPDEHTRREVEQIVQHLRHDVDVIDSGPFQHMAAVSASIDRAAELLAAAYLGGTDGR